MVACCPVCLQEDGVLVHFFREINAEDILDKGEAQQDGAIIPSKRDILLHGQYLSCFAQLSFSGHTPRVFFAKRDEAAEVVGPCKSDETSTEPAAMSVSQNLGDILDCLLSRDFGDYRIVVPVRISHCLDETEASVSGVFAALLITDFINNEQHINLFEMPWLEISQRGVKVQTYKVAGRPELFIASIAVYVRAQKLIQALDKVCAFPVGEDVEGVDPSTRLRSCLSVVGVQTVLERTVGEEVWKDKLLKMRHCRNEAVVRLRAVEWRSQFLGMLG